VYSGLLLAGNERGNRALWDRSLQIKALVFLKERMTKSGMYDTRMQKKGFYQKFMPC